MTFPFLDVLRLTDDDQLAGYLANLRHQQIDWSIRNRVRLDSHLTHMTVLPDGEVVMGSPECISVMAAHYEVPYMRLRCAYAQIENRITSIREAQRVIPGHKENTVAQMHAADRELREATMNAGFAIDEAHVRDCLGRFFSHQRYLDQTIVSDYLKTGQLPKAA